MNPPRLTVLYDGGCPLCSREINHYRRLAGDRPLRWIDAARPDVSLAEFGVSRDQALRIFHVFDRAGEAHTGARGFIALWAELPGYRWLASVCQAFGLAPVLDWGYRHFARRHYARRCRDGVCGTGYEPPAS